MTADIAALATALGRPLTAWQEQVAGLVLSGRPVQMSWAGRSAGKRTADRQTMALALALALAAGWHVHFLRPDGTWCTGPDYCKDLKRMEAPL
jgi:hypothetical protein